MSNSLITKKFGRELNDQETSYLLNIDKMQDKLPGRVRCTFTFRNNLHGGNYRIKYLKLGHVLMGMETFIYERVNINENASVLFDNYVIGTRIGHVVGEHIIKSTEVSEAASGSTPRNPIKKKDEDNIYDKLYVQFVIEKEINGVVKEIVYNQSYKEFMKQELFDIFSVGGSFDPEMLNYINIQLFFDPKYNTVSPNTTLDDLKLKLSVSIPTDHVISTDGYVL